MKLSEATKSAKTKGGLDRSKLRRDLARNFRYVQHVDRAIAEHPDEGWSFEHTAKPSDDAWHPSSDCTPSLCELYDKATKAKTERQPSVSLLKTWMVGQFWHSWLQHITVNYLGFCGWEHVERRGHHWWGDPQDLFISDWKTTEIRRNGLLFPATHLPRKKSGDAVFPEAWHWATGSGDIAPATLPGFGEQLVDYKTMNAGDYKRNEPPGWTADKWECQLNIYMDWFDLEDAVLVGVLKDNPHEMKEFHYTRNDPLIDAIYEKWHIVSDCLDAGERPPEPDDKDSFEVELPLKGVVD